MAVPWFSLFFQPIAVCDPICIPNQGQCTSPNNCTCNPGFLGSQCEHRCPSGTYGLSCASTCDCANNSTCDVTTGECQCSRGYQGVTCEEECSQGFYGDGCSSECLCRNETSTCDHRNGLCSCAPGWTGALCDTPCRAGTFGQGELGREVWKYNPKYTVLLILFPAVWTFLMIGKNQSMRTIMGRWRHWRHQSNRKRGHICCHFVAFTGYMWPRFWVDWWRQGCHRPSTAIIDRLLPIMRKVYIPLCHFNFKSKRHQLKKLHMKTCSCFFYMLQK